MISAEQVPSVGSAVSVVVDASHWDLVVEGDLDLCSGRQLVEVAALLASYRVPVAEIDLHAVDFVDPAGWRCVEEATRVLSSAGTLTTLRRPSEAVEHLRALFHALSSSSTSLAPSASLAPTTPSTGR